MSRDMELQVLQGATDCLENRNINFIYLETGLDNRFNSLESIIAKLTPFGYQPFGFYENKLLTGQVNKVFGTGIHSFAKEELL